MSKKNNAFFFSPGGYGPYSRLDFWGEHVDAGVEESHKDYDDYLQEAIEERAQSMDVDYGCYYITRERAEELLKELKELLEEEHE